MECEVLVTGDAQVVGGDPGALARVADVFARVGSQLAAAGQEAVRASSMVAPDAPVGSIGSAIDATCGQVNEFMLEVTALMAALTGKNGAATADLARSMGQTGENAGDIAAGWSAHH